MEKIWLKSYPPGVPAEVDASVFSSLNEISEQNFKKFAALPAFVQMGASITYRQLDEQSRRGGVPLRRLEHERVPGRQRNREHPQRHHRREVERCDPDADAERLAQRVHVDPRRDLVAVAPADHECRRAREVDDL